MKKVPALVLQKPVKGQHIFPANQIKELALQWKDAKANQRDDEAMQLLEQIIILSTEMFERLAQHEKFHYTVELPALVAAAQEKVANWLLHWEPAKGELFSWFSKSVTGDTQVTLSDGTQRRIDDIVNNRECVTVKSWNALAQCFENKPVLDWHRSPSSRKEWKTLSVKHPSGYWRKLYVTGDHEVMTTYGYKPVTALAPGDTLYYHGKCLTQAGRAAVIGMYLGDGCVTSQSYALMYGHGKKQLEYSQHVAALFGKTCNEYASNHSPDPASKICIPLLEYWPGSRNKLAQTRKDKKINDFVLSQFDDISLAYLYMDDGSLCQSPTTGAVYRAMISTCSFSEEDNLKLAEQIQRRLGISLTVKRRKTGYFELYVDKASYDRFYTVVAPYIISSLRYKLPEAYRSVPYQGFTAVAQELIPITTWKVTEPKGHKKAGSRTGAGFTPDWEWKYDVTIADNYNFLAESVLVHNCSKNAFRSEVVKQNQFRARYHTTGENLERFFGSEDPAIDKHSLSAGVNQRIEGITCRWANAQEKDVIRFHIAAILSGMTKNKAGLIRTGAYAYGVSPEYSKFFYSWALYQLRTVFLDMTRVPITEQDLFRMTYQYDHLTDLLDIITWPQLKQIIATLGGTRLRIPTITQLIKARQQLTCYERIDASDMDPDSVVAAANDSHVSRRTAQEVFEEMSERMARETDSDEELYDEDHRVNY